MLCEFHLNHIQKSCMSESVGAKHTDMHLILSYEVVFKIE